MSALSITVSLYSREAPVHLQREYRFCQFSKEGTDMDIHRVVKHLDQISNRAIHNKGLIKIFIQFKFTYEYSNIYFDSSYYKINLAIPKYITNET